MSSGDINISKRLFVGSDASLNSRLFVVGDASLNARLFIGGDASLNARLFVNGDASLNGSLTIGKDININGNLSVKQYSTNLSVYTVNYQLMVAEDLSVNGRLFITGDSSLNGRLFVTSDVSLNSRLFVGGDVSLNSRLFINGDVSLNSRLVVGGNVDLTTNNSNSTYSSTTNSYTQTNGVVSYYGNYTIITWTGTGTFIPGSGLKIGYVVVGGGAGGPGTATSYYGGSFGGGGGVAWSPLSSGPTLTSGQTYSIAVGAGTAGAAGSNANGWVVNGTSNAGASSISGSGITTITGGGGQGAITAATYTAAYITPPGGTAAGGVYNISGFQSTYNSTNNSSAVTLDIPEIGKYQLAYGGAGITALPGYGGQGGNWNPNTNGSSGINGTVFIYFLNANTTNTMYIPSENFKNTYPSSYLISPNATYGSSWNYSTSNMNYGYEAYKAFNNVLSDEWRSGTNLYNSTTTGASSTTVTTTVAQAMNGLTSIPGEWLQIKSNSPSIMKSYNIFATLVSALSSPRTFYVVGSTDGSTWYPIHYCTNTNTTITTMTVAAYIGLFTVASSGTQNGYTTTTYASTSSNAYTYFRIIVSNIFYSSGNTANYCTIGEWLINLNPTIASVSLALDPGMPNQLNVGGALNVNGTLQINSSGLVRGMAAGQVPSNSGVGSGTTFFNFTFASIPFVTATTVYSATNAVFSVVVYNITTTQFQWYRNYILTAGGSSVSSEAFNWIAISV